MPKPTNFIIYQAYGHEDILREALYSILSLFHASPEWAKDQVMLVIYTDQAAWFKARIDQATYHVQFEEITPVLLQEWRGSIAFVHRVKIKVLQDFFSKYSGNALYVDTDTSFLREVKPLFDAISQGKLYMHTLEGKISTRKDPIFRKLYRFLPKNSFQVAGQSVQLSVETEMWNAGVLGLNKQYAHLLEEVLTLTDEMHQRYPKHVIEQLAFSYVLRKQGPLTAAEEVIFHYWKFKEFRQILAVFFEYAQDKTFPQLIQLASNIPPSELIKPKLARKKPPFWVKFWRKITKYQEPVPVVDFARFEA